jgi:hypothetical protein
MARRLIMFSQAYFFVGYAGGDTLAEASHYLVEGSGFIIAAEAD